MLVEVAGIEHRFFDPTPRDVDALIRAQERVGSILVREAYEGELRELYHANGWKEEGPQLMVGSTLSGVGIQQIARTMLGNVGTQLLVGPPSSGGANTLSFWTPAR